VAAITFACSQVCERLHVYELGAEKVFGFTVALPHIPRADRASGDTGEFEKRGARVLLIAKIHTR